MPRSKDGNANSNKRKCKASDKKRVVQKAKEQTREEIEAVLSEVDGADGLPFEQLLGVERIIEVAEDLGYEYRERKYPPWVTLWAFLSQVSSKDSSCEEAVTPLRLCHRFVHSRPQ